VGTRRTRRPSCVVTDQTSDRRFCRRSRAALCIYRAQSTCRSGAAIRSDYATSPRRAHADRAGIMAKTPTEPKKDGSMKLFIFALVLALGIGLALPATNAYAWWCGPNRWCGPGPRVGTYVAPGVGFWWGRTWYPYPWRPGWDPGWRADPRRNYCDWHRC